MGFVLDWARKAAYALLVVLVVFIAYTVYASPPHISTYSLEWGEVTEDYTEVKIHLVVENSSLSPIIIDRVSGAIYFNEVKMGFLVSPSPTVLLPMSSSPIELAAVVDNTKLGEWLCSHVERGEETEIEISGYVLVGVEPIALKKPFTTKWVYQTNFCKTLSNTPPTELSTPFGLVRVSKLSASWGEISSQSVELIYSVGVELENSQAVTVRELRCAVNVNGVSREWVSSVNTLLKPGERATVTFSIELDEETLRKWWATHIANGESSAVSINVEGAFSTEVFGVSYEFTTPIYQYKQEFSTNLLRQAPSLSLL